jgi:hemerythrin-like domain-containing protein
MTSSRKRHDTLIPLSHQHHQGLVLSQRTEKGLARPDADLEQLAAALVRFFDAELTTHFRAEEEVLFPAMKQNLGDLAIIAELLAEHERLRSLIDSLRRPRSADRSMLQTFAELLRSHIQREERELFVTFEDAMPPERANELAGPIKEVLAADSGRGPSCSVS